MVLYDMIVIMSGGTVGRCGKSKDQVLVVEL